MPSSRPARRPFRQDLVRDARADEARLDSGAMWPISFALKELTAAAESKIRALVKKAVS